MAAHDSSWDIFRAELKRWMELRRVTNEALAEAVNAELETAGLTHPIDEQIVKRWRHSTSPPLASLKVIAATLAMSDDPEGNAPYDPTYLPRAMGVLEAAPEGHDLIEASYRLQSIRAKIVEAQSTLSLAAKGESLVAVVRKTLELGLASGVVPSREGPAGYPIYAADTIQLRHPDPDLDRGPVSVRTYPELQDALNDAFALPTPRTDRFTPVQYEKNVDDAGVCSWSVDHIARPRAGIVHGTHPSLPAVAVTSVTDLPYLEDVGAIIALLLGYGATSTASLARELVAGVAAPPKLRAEIHNNFLYSALPSRRVWTHAIGDAPLASHGAPFLDASGRAVPQLVHVFIAEDDEILKRAARSYHNPNETLRHYLATRDEVVKRAERLGSSERIVTLPIAYSPDRQSQWTSIFTSAARALDVIESCAEGVDLTEVHERQSRVEPAIMPQILRWMADHETSLVSRRWATAS